MSIDSIEDVAAAVTQPFWFQLYVIRDRGFVRDLIERARAAKCSALMVTLDLNVLGQRHCDVKNGMTVPPQVTLANLLDVASKPAWAWSILRGKRKTFGNLAGHVAGMENVTTLAAWISRQFDPTMTWDDIEWIRSLWPGKIILKGILDVEDAKIAARLGVSSIVVSNHGGRQLDGAPSSISMLPRIADAVGTEVELLFDGGIRTGMDVLRALALGARACLLGRAFVYGLGAGGEAGVAKAISIVANELDVAMALTGTTSAQRVGRDVIANLDA
jgi:L-lactate dehydrogenase (cytochrome)